MTTCMWSCPCEFSQGRGLVFVREVIINTDAIQLDQFLKWARITATGGEAKRLIQGAWSRSTARWKRRAHAKSNPGLLWRSAGRLI